MKTEISDEIMALQKANELTLQIGGMFDKKNDCGLSDQLHRASVSIIFNIAKGFQPESNEFKQFFCIAKGSCVEVLTLLDMAKELNKISENDFNVLFPLSQEISKILSGLINTS